MGDAFGIVSDLRNDPKWQQALANTTKVVAPPITEGTRYQHAGRLMGQTAMLDVEFRAYLHERRHALGYVDGPLEFTTAVRFEATARGTRVVILVAGQPKGAAQADRGDAVETSAPRNRSRLQDPQSPGEGARVMTGIESLRSGSYAPALPITGGRSRLAP